MLGHIENITEFALLAMPQIVDD